jgi:hypothetical protein
MLAFGVLLGVLANGAADTDRSSWNLHHTEFVVENYREKGVEEEAEEEMKSAEDGAEQLTLSNLVAHIAGATRSQLGLPVYTNSGCSSCLQATAPKPLHQRIFVGALCGCA